MHRRPAVLVTLITTGMLVVASCGSSTSTSSGTAATTAATTAGTTIATTPAATSDTAATTPATEPLPEAPASETGDLTTGFEQASWAANVTVTYADGMLHYVSDGLPNHDRDAQYAIPTGGVQVPDASTATALTTPPPPRATTT